MATASVVAWILWAYLTEYGPTLKVLAICVLVIGFVVALVVAIRLPKRFKTRRQARITLCLIITAVLMPVLSMFYPGRVTYARFGLTVYGIIPVPALDVTVNRHGLLWFRDKSHRISMKEVQSLISPGVEMVIIGIGWDSQARVDEEVRRIQGCEVRILSTPEAFILFNKCVQEGKKAALLAHSTC